jgi:hypothetical protein
MLEFAIKKQAEFQLNLKLANKNFDSAESNNVADIPVALARRHLAEAQVALAELDVELAKQPDDESATKSLLALYSDVRRREQQLEAAESQHAAIGRVLKDVPADSPLHPFRAVQAKDTRERVLLYSVANGQLDIDHAAELCVLGRRHGVSEADCQKLMRAVAKAVEKSERILHESASGLAKDVEAAAKQIENCADVSSALEHLSTTKYNQATSIVRGLLEALHPISTKKPSEMHWCWYFVFPALLITFKGLDVAMNVDNRNFVKINNVARSFGVRLFKPTKADFAIHDSNDNIRLIGEASDTGAGEAKHHADETKMVDHVTAMLIEDSAAPRFVVRNVGTVLSVWMVVPSSHATYFLVSVASIDGRARERVGERVGNADDVRAVMKFATRMAQVHDVICAGKSADFGKLDVVRSTRNKSKKIKKGKKNAAPQDDQ